MTSEAAGTVTVVDTAALTGITPHKGPKAGGTQVTITGTNLDGASAATWIADPSGSICR